MLAAMRGQRPLRGLRWAKGGLSVLAAIAALLLFAATGPSGLVFQMRVSATQAATLTVDVDTKSGYRRVAELRTRADGQPGTLRADIPGFGVDHIRIEVGGFHQVLLSDAELFRHGISSTLSRTPLSWAGARSNSLFANSDEQGDLLVHVAGDRPFLDVPVAAGMRRAQAYWMGTCLVIAIGSFIGMWLFVSWATPAFFRASARSAELATEPTKITTGDPYPIIFSRPTLGILAALCLVAAVWVAACLHQSSIAKWDDYLPPENPPTTTLIGQPRSIRSDEWLVFTPWMLAQVATGSQLENPSIGAERSPLLASLPVAHPAALLQPEYWGFSLFSVERGLSWLWAFKLFGLFTSGFLLLLLLTRSDPTVSALGSLWVCGSSYTQWWFSTSLPQLLAGLSLSVVGFVFVLDSQKRVARAAGCVMLILGAATFVFHLYPAWQVTLGYLAAAIVLGLVMDRNWRDRIAQRGRGGVVFLVAAAAIVGGVLYVFLQDARATIQFMMDTTYPGQRVSVGGDKSWAALFDGFFEPWRVGESDVPLPPSNPSEASNFVLLFPLVIMAAMWAYRTAWRNGVLIALAVYCTLLTLWMTIALPTDAGVLLSRITLLSYVPPHRALLALGFSSCLLVATWIAWIRRQVDVPKLSWLVVPIPMAVAWMLGLHLRGIDPIFFDVQRLAIGVVLVGLASVAIFRGSLLAFALMVGLVVVPGFTVNPLARGLAPILGKTAVAQWVEHSNYTPRPMWAVVGSFVLPQALKANGLAVFGGATWVPDRTRFQVLDPSGKYADIWNRYAHIQLESAPGLKEPEFEMVDSPSLYRVRLDVCSGVLGRLQVTHVIYAAPPPAEDMHCLSPLPSTGAGPRAYKLGTPGSRKSND